MTVGFITPPTGFALLFSNLQAIGDGKDPLLFLASLGLIGMGIYLIIHASREKKEPIAYEVHTSGESVLQRNNKIVAEWDKTITDESKLKLLKMKAESEERAVNS